MERANQLFLTSLSAFISLGAAVSSGQIHQPFPVHGTPVYQQSQPAIILTPPQTLCDCGCGSTGVCTEDPGCTFSVHPSSPTSPTIRNRKTLTSIMPTPEECIDGGSGITPFYANDIPTRGEVKVPRKTKNCVETFKFEKKSYTLCGCTINVCVPCEVYCVESGQCEPIPIQADLKIRVRTKPHNGVRVADVWAEDVMGLPKPAVLGLKKTPQQILQEFGATVSF